MLRDSDGIEEPSIEDIFEKCNEEGINISLDQIKTVVDFESIGNPLSYDLNYNDDVKTREIKADPALGGDATGIYFRGYRIRVNPAYGANEYSPWSIVYFKQTKVIYDLRFTPEQWEMREKLKEEWNIDDGSGAAKVKAINEITYRKKLEAIEQAKMHVELKQ